MPPEMIPDTDFVESAVVSKGFSQPAFIVKQDGVYYLTKVVWPYDPAMIDDFPAGDPRRQAILDIIDTFAGVPEPARLEAVFAADSSDISQSHASHANLSP